MGWWALLHVQLSAAAESRRSGFRRVFNSLMQGVLYHMHQQVKNAFQTYSLQLSAAAESQLRGVLLPLSTASGTKSLLLTNEFTFCDCGQVLPLRSDKAEEVP